VGVFLSQQSEELEWIIWTLEENENELKTILNCPSIAQQTLSIKTEKRKKEFLSSRILLKLLFGQCVEIDYKTSGAPYIKGTKWNISITHSGKYVAVARSKQPLGIDIEQISEKLNRTKHKYCSTQELNHIDNTQQLYHLTLHWSAKESIYKLIEDEPLIFDMEMQIEKFTPRNKDHFKLHLCSKKTEHEFKISYKKIDNYVLTYSTF